LRSNRKLPFHLQGTIHKENFSKRRRLVALFITASIHEFKSRLSLFGEADARNDFAPVVRDNDPYQAGLLKSLSLEESVAIVTSPFREDFSACKTSVWVRQYSVAVKT